MKNIKKYTIILLIIIVSLIILAITLNNNGLLKMGIKENAKQLSATKNITEYEIKGKDATSNELELLVRIKNEAGIDTIKIADTKIECAGKTKVTIDRKLVENSSTTIKVQGINQEEEEFLLIPTTEYTALMRVTETNINGEENNKVEIQPEDTTKENYYSIDNGETWESLTDTVIVHDIDTSAIKCNRKSDGIWEVKRVDEKKLIGYDTVTEVIDTIINETGYYKVMVQNENISMHAYVENQDLIIDETTEYGDSGDVATASSNAKNMVVLKVNGNLTVNAGKTLTAYGTSYGGPKGMYIFCNGKLENNGTISMTARGAKAAGQNVYLWKNQDNSYEYVKAEGATGATYVSSQHNVVGNNGTSGSNRETGGGGSGGAYAGTSGGGSRGTAYSGGAGGGGAYRTTAGSGVANGGAGGNALGYEHSTNVVFKCGGGAGNSGGKSITKGTTTEKGEDGTGGLLIIYTNEFFNNGEISSKGSAGANGYVGSGTSAYGGGGRRLWWWKYKHIL